MSFRETIDGILQDLRYALRTLRRSPGFTATVVITLGLGIGANTAIFSVIQSVILRPLPYTEPDELIWITGRNIETGANGIMSSLTKFNLVHDQARTLEGLGAYFSFNGSFVERGHAEQITAARAQAELFRVLDVHPTLGRTFLPAEDQHGGPDVALVSDAFWHNHYGGDPTLIGRSVSVDGRTYSVVGILPATFTFPFEDPEPAIWLPRVIDFQDLTAAQIRSGAGFLRYVGRKRAGVPVTQVQSEISTINARYKAENSGFVDANKIDLEVQPLRDSLTGTIRPALTVIFIAVGLMLLIACANVASLLLARATTREREIALRRALGASQPRLIRQVITESLLLSFAGGALGVLLASAALPMIRSVSTTPVPRVNETGINGLVLAFAVAMCLVTGVIFGIAPGIQFSRQALFAQLKEGTRGTEGGSSGKLRRTLVLAEVAVALVLVVAAGLLMESFSRLMNVRPGFQPSAVTTFPMALPIERYTTPEKQVEFYRQLVERVRNLPGVDDAGGISHLPLIGGFRVVFFCPEGHVCQGLGKDPLITAANATPEYFETMRIPLLRGRTFTAADISTSAPVVIINETTARNYFPNQDPIGKHLANSRDNIPMEIVGVVSEVKVAALGANASDQMYMPMWQRPFLRMTLVVRSTLDEQSLVGSVRSVVASLDPELPVAGVRRMEDVISLSVTQPRLLTQLVGGFSAFALLLAALGLYGMLAFSVAQRTSELGIRMALGATGKDIFRLVIGQGLKLVLAGAGIGIGGSLFLTKLLASQLFATNARDPRLFAGVVGLFVVVAVAACYIPARRAMRVDPIVALRYE